MSLFGGEKQCIVGEAQIEVFVEFTRFESAKAGDMPKRTGDIAAIFVTAVGAKRDPTFGRSEENGEVLTRSDVPEANGVVVGAGGDCFAIGGEGDAKNRRRMSFEDANGLARRNVPKANCVIGRSGNDGLAIGGKRDASDRRCVAVEDTRSLVKRKAQRPSISEPWVKQKARR